MRQDFRRTAALALALSILGFGAYLGGLAVSERIPGTPVAESMRLVSAALTGRVSGIPAVAAGAFSASRWYEIGVLPALAGIAVGLAAGLAVRPRPAAVLLGGLLFGLFLFFFRGDPPAVAWLGPLLFTFSSAGAAHLVADLREKNRPTRFN